MCEKCSQTISLLLNDCVLSGETWKYRSIFKCFYSNCDYYLRFGRNLRRVVTDFATTEQKWKIVKKTK